MTDIYLRQGDGTPNNVILRDPTQAPGTTWQASCSASGVSSLDLNASLTVSGSVTASAATTTAEAPTVTLSGGAKPSAASSVTVAARETVSTTATISASSTPSAKAQETISGKASPSSTTSATGASKETLSGSANPTASTSATVVASVDRGDTIQAAGQSSVAVAAVVTRGTSITVTATTSASASAVPGTLGISAASVSIVTASPTFIPFQKPDEGSQSGGGGIPAWHFEQMAQIVRDMFKRNHRGVIWSRTRTKATASASVIRAGSIARAWPRTKENSRFHDWVFGRIIHGAGNTKRAGTRSIVSASAVVEERDDALQMLLGMEDIVEFR